MPDYLQNKPVDLLIDPELTAEDFNDDTLGRCLEDLYQAGVTEVFYQVAAHALEVYGLRANFLHVDSSSFHLHGVYEPQEPGLEAISVTYGYSKDHRPDLKQIILQLITLHKSSLPVWFEVLSGNSNDKKTFPTTVKAYCQQLSAEQQPYLVMDSAGFSEDTLKEAQKLRWLMRVPETLAQAKKLVRDTLQEEMQALEPGYFGKEVVCEYAGIPQRWLVVFSEAARSREWITFEKAQAKELESAQKDWRKMEDQTFNCPEDAQTALETWNQKWKYHQAQVQIQPLLQFPRPGRPAAQDQKEVVGYLLRGEVTVNETAFEAARRGLGRFIIATNDLEDSRLSAQAMLENYKDQGVSVERGFRFLKDPLFFAHSLFLKKPERLMALLMVMGLALLIYSLAEHKLRRVLQEAKTTFPDQKGKATQTPTIRWVFQYFAGLDILLVRLNGQLIHRQLLNLRPAQQQVIILLGPQVQNCYLLGS
jgi:transposase